MRKTKGKKGFSEATKKDGITPAIVLFCTTTMPHVHYSCYVFFQGDFISTFFCHLIFFSIFAKEKGQKYTMKDIRLYHSLWRVIPKILFCAFGTAVGFHMLIVGDKGYKAWFCIAVFVFFGIYMLFTLLKERIWHIPYLVITDKSVRWWARGEYEILFANVKEFHLIETHARKKIPKRSGIFWIGVHYKDKKVQKIMTDAGDIDRGNESLIENHSEWEVVLPLPIEDLTIKPAEICKILNERLSVFHRTNNCRN